MSRRGALDGFGWLAGQATLSRVASVASNVALAALLAPADFGIWAPFSTIAAFARSGQEMGSRDQMTATPPAEQAVLGVRLRAEARLLTLGLAVVLVAVVALVSPDRLGIAVFISAYGVLGCSWPVAAGYLRSEKRFDVIARHQSVAAVVQAGAAILAAWLGLGATSFGVGLAFSAAYLHAVAGRLGPDSPVSIRSGWLRLPSRDSRRYLIGSLGQTWWDKSDYLVLALALSEVELGLYFFSYTIAAQAGSLLLNAAYQSGLPRVMEEVDNTVQRKTASRLGFITAGMSAVLGLATVVAFPLADRWLWGGRWESALVLVAVWSVAYVFRSSYLSAKLMLIARGQVRRWSRLTVLLGLCWSVSAAVVAILGVGVTAAVSTMGIMLALLSTGAFFFAAVEAGGAGHG